MGSIAIVPFSGIDQKGLTAVPSDVKEGVLFGGAGSNEPLTGTFASQTKTVTAGTSDVTVTPDTNKYLSEVTVHPTPTQEKTVTAGTSSSTVSPDSGKYLSSVIVEPTPSQTKSVSPTTSAQTVMPDSGKYLSSVSVSAIAGTWSEIYSNSTSNGTSMSYTTARAYKALLVCWNNSVTVTVTGNAPVYNSGVKSIMLGFSPKFRWLVGVPSGCVITHPTYDASVGNGYLRIYSLLA